MNLGMNLIFCMRSGIHRYIYTIQFIHMGAIRHTSACYKYFLILNLQYVKTELSYDANFLHMGKHQVLKF